MTDDLWALVAPLLPPELPKPNGGRTRVPDRACLTGIIFVLKAGLAWELLPQEMGCGSGVTCWRRPRDWQAAGVWGRLQQTLLDRLGQAGCIAWERACLDSAKLPTQRGGEAVGPNPTDRGKPGTKRHLITDAHGIPLASRLSGANAHDTPFLPLLLDAVSRMRTPQGGRRKRPMKLHADNGAASLGDRAGLRLAGARSPAHGPR